MKNSILLLCLIWVGMMSIPKEVHGQLERGHLYLIVYDDEQNLIDFKEDSNSVHFYFVNYSYPSKGWYSDTIIANVFSSFNLPIRQIKISYGKEIMLIEVVNFPYTLNITYLIEKVIFKPGTYELDVLKTKNDFIMHDKINICWDITPHYWYQE